MHKIKGYEGDKCCLECAYAEESHCSLLAYMVFCKKGGLQAHAWGKCPEFCSSEGAWLPRRVPAIKLVDIRGKND